MKISYLLYLITLFCVTLPSFNFSQTAADNPSTHIWFDDIIGRTNSGIFNGVAYTEVYRVINERHQFFKEPDFVPGSVVYDGQPYFDVELKYDVYQGNLLTRNMETLGAPILIFDESNVTEFTINGHRFKNVNQNLAENMAFGFLEVLMENDSLSLYKKHSKKIFKRTDKEILYYEFKDRHSYYIYYANIYHSLQKANDLNAIFPEYRKSLKAIRNRYASLGKSDPDAYMKSILSDLSALISSQSGKETL
ncbi:hypothetical protein [Ulvibacterium sp.]|uniref:hypothetical protein n=1 Tax=Ulvibacterium sp. TaxID=2665914 RepID=UPI003BAA2E48